MKKRFISKSTMERIVEGVTNLEEQKSVILDKYYSESSSKRDDFERLINKYISHIETFIKSASVVEKVETDCPFVTIGSNVEVIDLEENEAYTFRIISPLVDETPVNVDCVSYLSPIGKALLLKEVNDELDIKVSSQILKYKINGIWLMDA
jgi:transcription elongation factor GreA